VGLKQPRDGMDIWDIMDALFSMCVQLSQGAQWCRPKKLHLRSAHGAIATLWAGKAWKAWDAPDLFGGLEDGKD